MQQANLFVKGKEVATKPNASAAATASCLLNIPLEVRQYIYDVMLAFKCQDHLNLLCVNKQVYGEARDSFFRRPLACNCQNDLVDFTNSWPEKVQQSISNLKLRLEEVEPQTVTPWMAGQAAQHPYLQEIHRITSALGKLPGVTYLSLLRPLDSGKNTPSSIVMTRVLNWIVEHYTKLHVLKLDIEQCHISCLGSIKELQSLQFSGFSETSATRTAEVLSQLTSLESLSVTGPPPGLLMRQRHGYQTRIAQSVTHQVFQRIRPLKRLTLTQITDPKTGGDALLNLKTMEALYEFHRESLEVLKISSCRTPASAFIEFLSAFLLDTPKMQELSLTWPNTEITLVDFISSSIQRLEFAIDSTEQAKAIVDRLVLMQYRLRHLRRIKFNVINEMIETSVEQESKSSHLSFSLPIQHLAA
ncbi:uncharacterized protein Z520_10795 [Fonsecaea multimorphosa CBS 102226]|uniref:F-box domain-containing protein n=1 Tax=Fonsecaea multimorphosa CBS 102226 TaxID=1442371 RepID=A0A0D2JK40_9EURO|nr:uncharacterized protein Z520_10795 [Fonsecaea multimorphosa CBS 102226]KIX93617.1 hypothetical protein Z520_10795 [Fonsecaea multimorphosa CBS 102226]OAL18925.1 hypothetical protein AYO22_10254 [Fonsecaea multimorphosa]